MDPTAFLAMVFLISFTGALSPGPMTLATMVKGTEDPWAGIKVSLGHSIMEVPLIAGIWLGLMALVDDFTIKAIGIAGGLVLLGMGGMMLGRRGEQGSGEGAAGTTSFRVGLLTSVANPYAWVWWLTIGAALIAQALGYGLWMLPLFIVVHLSTDFAWMGLVALGAHRSRDFLSPAWMSRIVAGGGALLMLFGVYFIISSLQGISL